MSSLGWTAPYCNQIHFAMAQTGMGMKLYTLSHSPTREILLFRSLQHARKKRCRTPPPPPPNLTAKRLNNCSEYYRGKISKFWVMTGLLASLVYAVENPPSTKLAVMTSPCQRIVTMNTRDRIACISQRGHVCGGVFH